MQPLWALRCMFPGRARVLQGRGCCRGARAREKASPAERVTVSHCALGPLQAGRGVPRAAALLSLPRACQLGPNLISVLSGANPIKTQFCLLPTAFLPHNDSPSQGLSGEARSRAPCAGSADTLPPIRIVLEPPPGSPGSGAGPRLWLRTSFPPSH